MDGVASPLLPMDLQIRNTVFSGSMASSVSSDDMFSNLQRDDTLLAEDAKDILVGVWNLALPSECTQSLMKDPNLTKLHTHKRHRAR